MFLSITAQKNIALHKRTIASSYIGEHQRAVDGDQSVYITMQKDDDWIAVDLERTEHIDSVKVYLDPSDVQHSGMQYQTGKFVLSLNSLFNFPTIVIFSFSQTFGQGM